MTARYAVYVIPNPDSRLARFGRAWLGWDIGEAKAVPFLPVGTLPNRERAAIVGKPARYGFHATLRPPMKLADDGCLDEFLIAVTKIAAGHACIRGIRLELTVIGNFLALCPVAPDPRLNALAAHCVTALDGFRAPLETSERARREPGKLTHRQRELLDHWGYPFVLDEYRFHFTLSDILAPGVRDDVRDALAQGLQPILQDDLNIDEIAILVQDAPGTPFRRYRQMSLS